MGTKLGEPDSGIPRGPTPPALREQQRQEAELLRGAPPAPIRPALIPLDSGFKPPAPAPAYLPPKTAKHKVQLKIRAQGLESTADPVECCITFMAEDVSIEDFCISIALDDSFSFAPKDVLDLTLVHGGQEYPVSWHGGSFRFTDKGLNGISFTRNEPT